MKTKKDVYVVVNTPKKAKKLKSLLDMFNEPIYRETNQRLSENGVSKEYPNVHFLFGQEWTGYTDKSHQSKTEVSIKQLKQMLAKEYLKVGDYVLFENTDTKMITKLKYIDFNDINDDGECKVFYERMYSYYYSHTFNNDWLRGTFKRYATPEEIALLDPNPKELVVGKWYKCDDWLLMYDKDLHNCSGWFKNRYEYKYWSFDRKASAVTEATPQEVEPALIEEAKRRYKVGDKLRDVNGVEIVPNGSYVFKNGVLYYGGATVMKDGKWAEVIKNDDKFAELKEAHKNGAVIQFYNNYLKKWLDVYQNKPTWGKQEKYRIKPEEKPKVGDACKFWDDDENYFAVGLYSELRNDGILEYNIHGVKIANSTTRYFKFVKKLNKQQLLDLFPNIE